MPFTPKRGCSALRCLGDRSLSVMWTPMARVCHANIEDHIDFISSCPQIQFQATIPQSWGIVLPDLNLSSESVLSL